MATGTVTTDLPTVMRALEHAGTAQNRKVYPRHGITEPLFGVSYAELGKLQKRIKTDQQLAIQLWATGNHDARVLATKVADPAAMTVKLADAWARDLDNYVIAEALAALVGRAPIAAGRAAAWRDRKNEWVAGCGWAVTARLAIDGVLSDAECRRLLSRIRSEIGSAPNRVRHEMNGALIGIGTRGGTLRDRAISIAERIGPVHVDHGLTGCRTPDAAAYIRKVDARASRS